MNHESVEGDDQLDYQTYDDFKASITALGLTLEPEQEAQIKALYDQVWEVFISLPGNRS